MATKPTLPTIPSRIWTPRDFGEDVYRLRLSRAPLTFGHSQLVVSRGTEKGEGELFGSAAPVIQRAIEVFETSLSRAIEEETWKNLRRWTRTSGEYVKTLVLRSSASENPKESFSVHLVPFFASHGHECYGRFHRLHDGDLNEKENLNKWMDTPGGLLGWIGEREDEVDKLEVDYEDEKKFEQFATEFLRLPDLAGLLKEAADKLVPTQDAVKEPAENTAKKKVAKPKKAKAKKRVAKPKKKVKARRKVTKAKKARKKVAKGKKRAAKAKKVKKAKKAKKAKKRPVKGGAKPKKKAAKKKAPKKSGP